MSYLLIGAVVSFFGSLPFGPVNLVVVNITIRKRLRNGLIMSSGASIVEILHSFIALQFSTVISNYLTNSPWLRIAVFLLFLCLALYCFKPKKEKTKEALNSGGFYLPDFFKGALISLFNPQALPFWVFTIAYLQTSGWLVFDTTSYIMTFLLGICIGKFLMLSLYGLLGKWILKKAQHLVNLTDRIIGGVFLILALVQLFHLFIK